MIGINLKVMYVVQKTLNELICRLYRLETVERYSILNSGVVSIKGDDVVYAHIYKLLKSQCTIK